MLLAIPVLGVLAALGLALRLSAGPVEVGGLAALLRDRLAPSLLAGDRLRFGAVWLGWQGLRHGLGAPVTLAVHDVALAGRDGVVSERIGVAEVSLSLAPLLAGTVVVQRLRIADAGLALLRRRDGGLALDDGAVPPPGAPPGQRPGQRTGMPRLDRLRAVEIARSAVSLRDEAGRGHWRLDVSQASLRPRAGLLAGDFQATLSRDGHAIALHGHGVPQADGLSWQIAGTALVPAAIAGLDPALAPLAAIDLPVVPTLALSFAPGEPLPRDAALGLSLGAGTVSAGGQPVPVQSGRMTLRAHRVGRDGVRLSMDRAMLALRAPAGASDPAPVLWLGGTLSLDHAADPAHIRAALTVDSQRIGFAGLGRYWPAPIAPGARRWIVGNVTAGQATALHVETTLSGDAGWGSLREHGRTGGFDADDLVLWWLRPMPPLRDMRLHLTFQDTDAVLIESPRATLPVEAVGAAAMRLAGPLPPAPLAVTDASMRITGLDGDVQTGAIKATLGGGLGDLLVALANPRLSLLSRHPVPFEAPSGAVRAALSVSLPLDSKLPIEAIALSVQAGMTDVHLGRVAAGLSLDQAALTVAAGTEGLTLDGTGSIADIVCRLHYAMDFKAGGPDQLTEQADLSGTVTPSVLSRLGIDPDRSLSGTSGLDLDYKARRDGAATVTLGLDMTALAISLPIWSKRAGLAARAEASVNLDHGALVSVGPIHADGPDLSVEGAVTMPAGGARRLRVQRFQVGRTRGAGEVMFPQPVAGRAPAPIRIAAHGPVLDLAPIIDSVTPSAKPGTKAGTKPGSKPVGWTADLAFGRVFVGRLAALGQASAHLENDGTRIVRARVDAASPTPVALRLEPDGQGRRLVGSADDTGLLLQGLNLTGALSGGTLRLDARLDDRHPDAPITGTVTLGRVLLPDAPLAARVVRDLSVYGWLLSLPAPQLSIDRLVAPFALRDDVLTLTDARAHAAALGATLGGRVDLGRQRFDLQGTVVPAWLVNQLPGRLPLVGRLLAPEKGGGVIAATVSIQGRFADPQVHVNALSALAPGFLRKLFFE